MRKVQLIWIFRRRSESSRWRTVPKKHSPQAVVDEIGTNIIGGPLTTIEQFVTANRHRFVLEGQ
jgi:hypothetical protein